MLMTGQYAEAANMAIPAPWRRASVPSERSWSERVVRKSKIQQRLEVGARPQRIEERIAMDIAYVATPRGNGSPEQSDRTVGQHRGGGQEPSLTRSQRRVRLAGLA